MTHQKLPTGINWTREEEWICYGHLLTNGSSSSLEFFYEEGYDSSVTQEAFHEEK